MLTLGYDIRGILNKELTFELIEKVTQDFIDYLKKTRKNYKKIFLAVDANKNNFQVVEFMQKKFNFDFLGILPTPIFDYYVIKKRTPGIIITASHLPLKYSGLKFLLEDGSPWKPDLKEIKNVFKKQEIKQKKFKKSESDFNINKDIFKLYFEKLNSIVKLKNKIFVNFDIKNFFLNSSLPYFQKLKIFHSSNSEIKVESDGDNDRLYIFHKNKLVPADIIFYFLALSNKYQKLGVPIFFSQYLKKELLNKKKKIFLIKTGHYYFKKAYKDYKIDFAFEPSGHFYFFKDLKTEAPYLALGLFLHFLSKEKNKFLFEKILREVKIFRFNFTPSKNFLLLEKVIDKLKKEFNLKLLKQFDGYLLSNQDFYVHLRTSNTENKLRVTYEGKESYLKMVKNKLKNLI